MTQKSWKWQDLEGQWQQHMKRLYVKGEVSEVSETDTKPVGFKCDE